MAFKGFKLALIQLSVGSVKKENLARAVAKIKEAANNGANLVALPECFNSPYGTNYFKQYAEEIPGGESCVTLSTAAKENNIYLIGGSIPESIADKYYNTCTVWNNEGAMIGKHQKMHLFDIDIPGGIKFTESSILSAGDQFTTFDFNGCKVGVGICYDIRFAELAQVYANAGCKLLIYPGAFNMTTGPLHWDLLQRARSVDNQLYVATVSPARDTSASYTAWGHSSIVNPFGKVVATTEHEEDIIYHNIDLSYIDEVRQMIPISKQRRNELYDVIAKKKIVKM